MNLSAWGLGLVLPFSLVAATTMSSGCSSDDCTRTLTCEPSENQGGTSANGGGTTTANGGTGNTGGGDTKKANGTGCGDNSECDSNQCVDAVCCATPCDGECQSCSLPSTEGTCTPNPAGTDPESECGEGSCSGLPTCARGEELWAVGVNTTGSISSADLATDSEGNAYLLTVNGFDLQVDATPLDGGGFANSMFLVQLTDTGSVEWSHVTEFSDADYIGSARLAATIDDQLIVAGFANVASNIGDGPSFGGSAAGDVFLSRLNTDGSHIRTTVIPKTAGFNGVVTQALTVDEQGNAYLGIGLSAIQMTLCGASQPSSDNGLLVASFDTLGNCRWGRRWTTPDSSQTADFATDGQTLFATGILRGSLNLGATLTANGDEPDAFVAAISTADGTHQWSKRFGDQDPQVGTGVVVHPNDEITIAGAATGTIDFGGPSLPGANDFDATIARLSNDGAHISSSRHGSGASQRAVAVAVGDEGFWYLLLHVDGTVQFGDVGVTTPTTQPVLVAFRGPDALWARTTAPSLPNSTGISRLVVAPNGDVLVFSGETLVRYGR